MMFTKLTGRALAIAATLTLASQVPAQAETEFLPGAYLRAAGGDVFVTLVSSTGGYSSDVMFFTAVGAEGQFLFNNLAPGSGTAQLSGVAADQELIFGIFVTNTRTGQSWTYYTGYNSNNPDGVMHARAWKEDGKVYIGFEDKYGGGDFNYEDVVFEVSGAIVNPEPITMVLLGSGLFGLGGAGLARRRREAIDLEE